MDISVFAFRLLLLFFPGIICSYIVDTLTTHKERTQFQFLVNSFILGLSCYLIYWSAIIGLGIYFSTGKNKLIFLTAITDSSQHISYQEIVYVCLVAILIGIVITLINTYKLHFKLAHKLKLTRKFGELDVWGYLMNSTEIEWVTVRDLKNNLMYDGWIQAFSDNSKEAELLLGDVSVFNNDSGKVLYNVSVQYLSLDRNNISIEIRNQTSQN